MSRKTHFKDFPSLDIQPEIAHSCLVVIPIYKDELSTREENSLRTSFENLQDFPKTWIAPKSIKKSYYVDKFADIAFSYFDDYFFKSVRTYSSLLLSEFFYRRFISYDFILICQTDAIVIKPELGFWLNQPYDYIGAPWPLGWRFYLPNLFETQENLLCQVFVGNGGLSLRRVKSILSLLSEFPSAKAAAIENGFSEDLFISACANFSSNCRLPNIATAAKFSQELLPDFLCKVVGTPFGLHGWNRPQLGNESFLKYQGPPNRV